MNDVPVEAGIETGVEVGAPESHGEGAASGVAHGAAHADPVCPYCGGGVPASVGRIGEVGTRCPSCKGLLDDLSIHATRGHMGEWFVRDEGTPFRPGCSLATLRAMIERGRVTATSVVRGPDTEQFWHRAGHVPRIARLMGVCPECLIAVDANAAECASCGTHLMSMGDAIAEHWHGHGHGHAGSLAAAVSTSKTAAAEIAEAAVKRQMQREVQTWARRAGLSIGIAVFLFLIVIALATKDMWWARATGGASVAPVTTPVTPPAAPVVAPEAAPAASEARGVESESPKGEETPSPAPVPAPGASEPAPAHTPGPAVRSGRDPLWEQVGPLVIADTTESLKQAQELLQRIGENAGAERANEREQANALREWIERRLTARELNTLP